MKYIILETTPYADNSIYAQSSKVGLYAYASYIHFNTNGSQREEAIAIIDWLSGVDNDLKIFVLDPVGQDVKAIASRHGIAAFAEYMRRNAENAKERVYADELTEGLTILKSRY